MGEPASDFYPQTTVRSRLGSTFIGAFRSTTIQPDYIAVKSGPILPMSAPTATTPSNYTVAGVAISNNRAWQYTVYFGRTVCTNVCIVTDRKRVRNTITPGQNTVRVESSVYDEVGGSGVSVPHVVGRVYEGGAQLGSASWTDSTTGTRTTFINVANLWVSGRRIIVGLEEHAYVTGQPELKTKSRTLTATCFPAPSNYCAWWV